MKKLKMKVTCSGIGFAYSKNVVYEVEDLQADEFLRIDWAELVEAPKKNVVKKKVVKVAKKDK